MMEKWGWWCLCLSQAIYPYFSVVSIPLVSCSNLLSLLVLVLCVMYSSCFSPMHCWYPLCWMPIFLNYQFTLLAMLYLSTSVWRPWSIITTWSQTLTEIRFVSSCAMVACHICLGHGYAPSHIIHARGRITAMPRHTPLHLKHQTASGLVEYNFGAIHWVWDTWITQPKTPAPKVSSREERESRKEASTQLLGMQGCFSIKGALAISFFFTNAISFKAHRHSSRPSAELTPKTPRKFLKKKHPQLHGRSAPELPEIWVPR